MSDQRVGAAFRAVRVRKRWRQEDVARAAGVSKSLVSAIERGHIAKITIDSLRTIAAVLDVRVDVLARWRGGELDRLLNARHSALAESVTRALSVIPGWTVAPEVSFAFYGERGWIDLLAWHAPTRTLVVIEIKTAIVDLQDLLGVLDRKTRLAARIARERGWFPEVVATWLVVAEGTTNRRHVADHSAIIRSALPAGTREMRRWLQKPSGRIAGLSFLPYSSRGSAKRQLGGLQRVRTPNRC